MRFKYFQYHTLSTSPCPSPAVNSDVQLIIVGRRGNVLTSSHILFAIEPSALECVHINNKTVTDIAF
jgi:hypothetical protein